MKQDKRAASRDMFDQGGDSQPGERQTDIEAIIEERSLFQIIRDGDKAAEDEMSKRAAAGEIIRII